MGSRQAESSDPHHRPSHARVRRAGRGRDHGRAGEAAEEGRLFDLTGVPDERIAVRVDTRAVAARKWAAILRPRPPGGPVTGDLLTGLAGAEAGR